MILPKNTHYNRRLNLLNKPGQIALLKNGILYFYFEINAGERTYFKCDVNIFKKQFDTEENQSDEISLTEEELEVILKNAKKYPL